MGRLKSSKMLGVAGALLGVGMCGAQAPAAGPARVPAAPAAAPLRLSSLDSPTQADPFPPVNPKYFTADSPTVATVESYLKAMLGFDPNRIWRVAAIQKTASPGVTKITALVSEKGPNAKVLSAVFFVMPDGKHLIGADAAGLSPFGAEPFAADRATLMARANGPALGAAAKDLLLVEFADLQCPHCKDAQAVMSKLAQDFPKARLVYQSDPLIEIHPFAFQAAAYGVCVARQSANSFFTYAQAVYNTQGALVPDTAEQTLKDAATKAGADPVAIAACAATEAAKAEVNQSLQLATDLHVDSTPMLSINGRMVNPLGVPYETLKALVVFQAQLDGVSGAAMSPAGSGVSLNPR